MVNLTTHRLMFDSVCPCTEQYWKPDKMYRQLVDVFISTHVVGTMRLLSFQFFFSELRTAMWQISQITTRCQYTDHVTKTFSGKKWLHLAFRFSCFC